MICLIDTDWVVDYLKGKAPAVQLLESLAQEGAAISLITVIATSSAVSAGTTGRNLINLRLGMLLEVASAAGGVAAGLTVSHISDVTLERGFAGVAALIAVLMLTRLERRNVIEDTTLDPGSFGGTFHDEESGCEVLYRVRRLPAAMIVSFIAGNVSASRRR